MNANAIALDALKAAKRAINSMKVEAETAGAGGDQQMLQDACETISNEGLAASTALDKAIAALQAEPQPEPVAQIVGTGGTANLPLLQWLSADHSFRAPIGSTLYALPTPPKD